MSLDFNYSYFVYKLESYLMIDWLIVIDFNVCIRRRHILGALRLSALLLLQSAFRSHRSRLFGGHLDARSRAKDSEQREKS
jgi:hypothetical protein